MEIYFNCLEGCKKHLTQIFIKKDTMFWEHAIIKLLEIKNEIKAHMCCSIKLRREIK